MARYVRAAFIDHAYQVKFTDEQKEEAKKGLAVSSHGSHIKHDDGVFSVFIHLGDDGKQVKEGEWVVREGSNSYVVSEDDFEEKFQEVDEDGDPVWNHATEAKEDEEDLGKKNEDVPPVETEPKNDETPVIDPVKETFPQTPSTAPVVTSDEGKSEGSETAVD